MEQEWRGAWSRSSFCRGGESPAARRSAPRCAHRLRRWARSRSRSSDQGPAPAPVRPAVAALPTGPGRVRRSDPASLRDMPANTSSAAATRSAVSASLRLSRPCGSTTDCKVPANTWLCGVADHDPIPYLINGNVRRDRRCPDSRPTSVRRAVDLARPAAPARDVAASEPVARRGP